MGKKIWHKNFNQSFDLFKCLFDFAPSNFEKFMITKEENILFSAEKLFAEKGFEGTSTREISKEANVNISMISYYFGSKEKLLHRIFEYRMTEGLNFANTVLENESLNAWEKLSLIIDKYSERVKNLRNFYLIFQREHLAFNNEQIVEFLKDSKKNFLKMYERIIEEGNKEKIFTKKQRLEFIHSTVSGTMFTAMNTLQVYKEFQNGGDDYQDVYYTDLNVHLKNILKHLLGYEENN